MGRADEEKREEQGKTKEEKSEEKSGGLSTRMLEIFRRGGRLRFIGSKERRGGSRRKGWRGTGGDGIETPDKYSLSVALNDNNNIHNSGRPFVPVKATVSPFRPADILPTQIVLLTPVCRLAKPDRRITREQFHPNDNISHIVTNPRAHPPYQPRYPDGKRKKH
ncbi:hypothetical protein ElyMa_002701600 [Elysia marginata]|uniref:Uncharacterized protein n=1 Tax=Elysia marginata TaxID=1093978 RepID=A0AAV4HFC8_9GAST|nr:hypothetical protein ElyMa_002701600 [Elysia marginata]